MLCGVVIGMCDGSFDRVMSLKGPRNEGNFCFFLRTNSFSGRVLACGVWLLGQVNQQLIRGCHSTWTAQSAGCDILLVASN